MPPDIRAAFIAAVEPIESPGHLDVIAHHLMRGDWVSAVYVSRVPSSIYAARDAAILFAYAWGRIQRG